MFIRVGCNGAISVPSIKAQKLMENRIKLLNNGFTLKFYTSMYTYVGALAFQNLLKCQQILQELDLQSSSLCPTDNALSVQHIQILTHISVYTFTYILSMDELVKHII